MATSEADEVRPIGTNAYQMVTGDDSEDDRHRWDKLFDSTDEYVYGKEPSPFLKNSIRILHPKRPQDRALDLAMGEGRNSVFLAENGYWVEGVDISEVALQKARKLAKTKGVLINTINADLNNYTIKPDNYQLIVNFDYVQRSLIPGIKRGLKKGGIIVYEGYTVDQVENPNGQYIRRDYLLQKGELKTLFKEWEILHYHEQNDGKEAKASLIARKP